MLDLILAVGLLTFAAIAFFTPGAWAVKARWLVSIMLAGLWGWGLLRAGEAGLIITLCILVGMGLMLWCGGLERWALGVLLRFWRWKPWWRPLAQYSRTARRRLGGHWEEYAESSGLIDGGWITHWQQVEVCHLTQPCRHQIAGVWGCGARCTLTRCEEWSHQVGPGDNIVGEDDPNIALSVQVEEQRQRIEALFGEAKEALETRQAWQKGGSLT